MVDDAFGYAYKYASKPNGESYTLSADPNIDNRFETDQNITNNGDGTYRFEDDDEVDFSILTSALFNEDDIIDNHSDLDIDQGGRGYMMNVKDWRDVEVTFHFRVEDYTSDDGFRIYLGGGRHSNPQPGCEGCSYVWRIFWNGDLQALKEQWHNHKVPVPFEDSYITYPPNMQVNFNPEDGTIEGAFNDLREGWMLCKFVRYNVKQNDGATAVKNEFWYNSSGDKKTWVLITEVLDVSGWGDEGQECEGNDDQVLNWAYPCVRIYWRNASRVDWYGLTIREIIPQAPVSEDPGDTGGGGTGGQPDIPPPEQPTGKVSKIGSFRFAIASSLATSCDGVEPDQPSTNPNPPPDGGTTPPPPAGGTLSFTISDYFKVGS